MYRLSLLSIVCVLMSFGCGGDSTAPVPGGGGDGGMSDAGSLCLEDERVKDGACDPCEAGKSNEAGDDPRQGDTECDLVPCPEYSMGSDLLSGCACVPGATGMITPVVGVPYFEGACMPVLCEENEFVMGNACVPCAPGATNAAGNDATQMDTACMNVLCGANEFVMMNTCVPCPAGSTNVAGDDASGIDTLCDPILCDVNERVMGNRCVACEAGTTSLAGADASGPDTSCEPVACPAGSTGTDVATGCTCLPGYTGTITPSTVMPYYDGECMPVLCGADEYVMSNACTACPAGTTNVAGDAASGMDTMCDPVACPPRSVGESVAAGCVCGPGSSGMIVASTTAPYYTGECSAVFCRANQRVVSNVCVACPQYTTNAAGDDASGLDTGCEAQLFISEAGRNLTNNLYEALELYNNSARPMDLTGFSLHIFDGVSGRAFGVHRFSRGTTIPVGSAFGIIEEILLPDWRRNNPAEAAEIDLELGFNWSWDDGNGAVILTDASGEVVDAVFYGSLDRRIISMPSIPGPLWSGANVAAFPAGGGTLSTSWQRNSLTETNTAADWSLLDKTWGRSNRW